MKPVLCAARTKQGRRILIKGLLGRHDGYGCDGESHFCGHFEERGRESDRPFPGVLPRRRYQRKQNHPREGAGGEDSRELDEGEGRGSIGAFLQNKSQGGSLLFSYFVWSWVLKKSRGIWGRQALVFQGTRRRSSRRHYFQIADSYAGAGRRVGSRAHNVMPGFF